MADGLLALSRRIARMRLDPEPQRVAWESDNTITPGLPATVAPFFMLREKARDGRSGNWSIAAYRRTGGDLAIIFDKLPDEFTAFRRMVDAFEAWQQVKPVERVYFIGTDLNPGSLVKVGRSLDPESRLKTIQTGHPERLCILATTPGGAALEEQYHRRWRARRRTGEWFTMGECIAKEINRINQSGGA